MIDAMRELGLPVRAGLHTGECERVGTDVSGIAVHVGARIAAAAGAGEAVVSSTVRDLVAGSGLRFVDRGQARPALHRLPHERRGMTGERSVAQGSLGRLALRK